MDVPVTKFRVHPAQIRTRISITGLAMLAIQVSGGVNPLLPLETTPGDDGTFIVVSGHRRWLAAMVAFCFAPSTPLNADEHLEDLVMFIRADLGDGSGNYIEVSEGLYTNLAQNIGDDLTLPVRVTEIPPAAQVEALIMANIGAESPDLLGCSIAYQAALDHGHELADLARMTGYPVGYIEAVLALPLLPEFFQGLINDGLLDLEIVPELETAEEEILEALEKAIREHMKEAHTPHSNYTVWAQSAIHAIHTPILVPDYRDTKPNEVNTAKLKKKMWEHALTHDMDRLYEALAHYAMKSWRAPRMEILGAMPSTKGMIEPGHNFTQAAVEELLDGGCETCVFDNLPKDRRLKHALPFPCREQSEESTPVKVCLNYLPNDGKAFHYRLHWKWDRAGKMVHTLDELLHEWDMQEAIESGRGLKPEKGPSPIEQQRADIRCYMERHAKVPFLLAHPWATSCLKCAWHTQESPVKSAPDAPHCAWAKGIKSVYFDAFVPVDRSQHDFIVPSCRQFKPAAPWSEVVPSASTPPPFPRDVMVALALELGLSVNKYVYSTHCRGALQWLTGKPEKVSANHRKTFAKSLMAEVDALSDEQIWTILQWLQLEYLRVSRPGVPVLIPWLDNVIETQKKAWSLAVEVTDEETK